MTEITFYFNAADKFSTARALAGKAYAKKQRVLIYSSDERTLTQVGALLWSVPATAFLPHCRTSDEHAAQTPILMTADANALPHHEILINLDAERPALFSRFDRLIEIVSRDDASDRDSARERFRFYRDRGYDIARHDLVGRA